MSISKDFKFDSFDNLGNWSSVLETHFTVETNVEAEKRKNWNVINAFTALDHKND